MLQNEGDRLIRAIVCAPRQEYFHVDDLKAHNITAVADSAKTKEQFNLLKLTMAHFGVEVIDVP